MIAAMPLWMVNAYAVIGFLAIVVAVYAHAVTREPPPRHRRTNRRRNR